MKRLPSRGMEAMSSTVSASSWRPGEDWDRAAFAYRRAAVRYHDEGLVTLPADIKPGQYIVALALLDRQGGMMPSARFANENYFRGGWHPLGLIGVGEAPKDPAFKERREAMQARLFAELRLQHDLRMEGNGAKFDEYPYASPNRDFYNRWMKWGAAEGRMG